MSTDKKQSEFLQWMPEILNALRALDGSGKPKEISLWIANKFELPDSVLEANTKTGVPRFYNQVAWARQYLVWEGLLDSSKRGTWSLTLEGEKAHLDAKSAKAIFSKWVKIHAGERSKASVKSEEEVHENSEIIPSIVESAKSALLKRLKSV